MERFLLRDPNDPNDKLGKETRNSRMYHIEFRNFFWRKPGKYAFYCFKSYISVIF